MSTTTLQEDAALTDKKPRQAAPTKRRLLHPLLQRHKKPLITFAAVLALIATLYYSYDAFTHEETDDAYVTGHIHNISARINGTVTDVMVRDNQQVKEGDVLVKLDASEYLALMAAAKATLAKAQSDLNRQEPLVDAHAIAPQDVDSTRSTRDVDAAEYRLAQLQIEYSTLTAPNGGTVGRKSVEVGNRITSGQTLMVIVEPELWVVANFKETQLAHMKPGQPATLTIDSIPGKVFTGRVDSFSPATGNQFALLPADNATGNFTKIVQRVPVKVVFDHDSTKGYEDRIRAGESAIVKVALTEPPSAH